jgi:hypothetical protein
MSKPTKPIAELTDVEVRKLITSGVANGVLQAGIVLLVMAFALGFILGTGSTPQ